MPNCERNNVGRLCLGVRLLRLIILLFLPWPGLLLSAPLNDYFTNRFPLMGSSITLTSANFGASRESGEPVLGAGGLGGGRSLWWTWTAPANGNVRVSTIGSKLTNGTSMDTILGIYTNSLLPQLGLVTSDDDNGGNMNSLASFNALSNTEYQITVDGFGGAVGNIILNLHLSNTPPSLLLASPTNNAICTEPATIPLVAYASDYKTSRTVTGVVSVTYFQNQVLLKRLTPSASGGLLFSNTWTNVAAGSYLLTAVSSNTIGLTTTSAPVTVTVRSNTPPAVSLLAPTNNAVFYVPATIPLSADASDPGGAVVRVEFYENENLLGQALTSPYAITWTNLTPGTYTLTAVACDNGNLRGTSAPVSISVQPNIPPQVSLTNPLDHVTLIGPATILLSANASDVGGTITNVEFYQATTRLGQTTKAPYSLAWSNVPPGSYTLQAVAYDNGGLSSTSAPVTITIRPNVPPVVNIDAPAPNTILAAPANISIAVSATDSDDPIAKVEFYRNGLKLGTVTNAPYRFTWNGVSAGAYSLMAVATDRLGARGTSQVVSITVTGTVLMTYIVHISVDGLAATYLQACLTNNSEEFPNFMRLVNEGAYTFNARCDYFNSVTIPNHACMLTGRPVQQPSGQPNTVQHGYTGDFPDTSENLQITGNLNIAYKASPFDVIHDHGLSTALYASKSKFGFYVRSWDSTYGAPDAIEPDDGRNKIDFSMVTEGSSDLYGASEQLVDSLLQYFNDGPWRYTFLHFSETDYAGHSYGWGSANWSNAVRHVDQQLGRIFGGIESNPGLLGQTAVLLSADHGGSGTGHSDATNFRDYTIPLFVWGGGIPANTDLYTLFSNRADPGSARPDYNAHPQPLRNGDTGNIALMLLGLPPVAGSTLLPASDQPTSLSVSNCASGILVSWPLRADSYKLQCASALASPPVWQTITNGIAIVNDRMVYTVTNAPDWFFFRLRK